MAISVSSLLQNSFSSWSFDEKLAIVTNGKPKPDMSTCLSCSFSHKGRKINRKFSNNHFETIVPDNTPIPGLQMILLESHSSFVILRKNKHKISKNTNKSQ